jgi:hypothetical protein
MEAMPFNGTIQETPLRSGTSRCGLHQHRRIVMATTKNSLSIKPATLSKFAVNAEMLPTACLNIKQLARLRAQKTVLVSFIFGRTSCTQRFDIIVFYIPFAMQRKAIMKGLQKSVRRRSLSLSQPLPLPQPIPLTRLRQPLIQPLLQPRQRILQPLQTQLQ